MASGTLELDDIPTKLTNRHQWVCWREEDRDGKATKVPVDPQSGSYASTTDPETWAGLETALDRDDVDGIGFVFTEDGPFVGVDLDDCRDPDAGEPTDETKSIIDKLDSYTEVSPSGTGYHVLLQGELPRGGNRSGNVEMYESARFFTVTGDHVAGTPSKLSERSDALEAIHEEYVQSNSTEDDSAAPDGDSTSSVTLSDEELLVRAQTADNGEKFQRLWHGSTQGYESHSEADMALCCQLAFWTGGDADQIDRLFRRSGLLREKWDEVHYSDGSTYGEKTIERAIQRTSEFYDPSCHSEQDRASACSVTTANTNRQVRSGYLGPSAPQSNREMRQRVVATETTLEHIEPRLTELEQELITLQEQVEQERRAREALSDRVETLKTASLRTLFRQLIIGVLR